MDLNSKATLSVLGELVATLPAKRINQLNQCEEGNSLSKKTKYSRLPARLALKVLQLN